MCEFACCVVAWQFKLFLGRLQNLNMASFFRGACQKVHVALLHRLLLSAYFQKLCANLPVALLRGGISKVYGSLQKTIMQVALRTRRGQGETGQHGDARHQDKGSH